MKTVSKLFVLACCLAGLRASAQLNTYTDLASWQAAVNPGSITSVNFEGIVGTPSDPNYGLGLNNFTYYSSPPGLTIGDANFQYTSPTPGLLFLLGDDYYYSGQPAELSAQDFGADPPPGDPDGITVTFAHPITAFDMTFESFFGTPFTFTAGGGSYTQTAPTTGAGLGFVGITSDTPFTSFTVTTPAEFAMSFASLSYGSVPDVFSTAWTLCLGLAGCGMFRRLRGSR